MEKFNNKKARKKSLPDLLRFRVTRYYMIVSVDNGELDCRG